MEMEMAFNGVTMELGKRVKRRHTIGQDNTAEQTTWAAAARPEGPVGGIVGYVNLGFSLGD